MSSLQKYTSFDKTEHHPTLTSLCIENKLDILQSRVNQGENIREQDAFGNLLTHTAAYHNRLDILKWLALEKQMNLNETNSASNTVLHVALEAKQYPIVEWLIKERIQINLNVTIEDLCVAVKSGDLLLVKEVVKVIRNVCQGNSTGKSAIEIAREENKQEIEYFLYKKALFSILREPSTENIKLKKLKKCIDYESGILFNEIVSNGGDKISAVMLATKKRYFEIVKWLVEKGADPNSKNQSGSSLLAEITQNGTNEDFQWLVNHGASIRSTDANGNFAIEKFVSKDNVEMIRWCVKEKNLNIMENNDNGVGIANLSVKDGKLKVLKFLIDDAGLDVKSNINLLPTAIRNGHLDVVKTLMKANADVMAKDGDGKTAIDLAVEKKYENIVQILIFHVANKIIRSNDTTEDMKTNELKKIFDRYGYKYISSRTQLSDTDNLSKSVIDIAEEMKLKNLTKWLTTNVGITVEGRQIPETTSQQEYNILLIGETGVGKSTFVNAFVNYINFSSLQEAYRSDKVYCLIPSRFTLTDENYQSHDITFGEDENESFSIGQSSTQSARSYSIVTDTAVLRIIDTPGIGDTRGIDKDLENFNKLLKMIAELKSIHAICVMLKPNNARLSVLFEYCIKGIFSHLDKSASKNIVFLFTNCRGTFYRPGDTLPPLLNVLEELKGPPTNVTIPLNKKNVFCLDNESFRFLLAKKQNVTFDDEEEQEFSLSWNKSSQVCRSLVEYVIKLKPHNIQDTVSINAARRLVLALSKPLTEIAEHINKTTLHLQITKEQIDRSKGDIAELQKHLHGEIPVLKLNKLTSPVTACQHRECLTKINILNVTSYIEKICHKRCVLENIVLDVKGHESLRNCNVIRLRCLKCGHSYRDHIHLCYMKKVVKEKIPNLQIEHSALNYAEVENVKRKIEGLNNDYKKEEDAILKSVSKFSHFLKHNSIVAFNDICKSYIENVIEEERGLGNFANDTLLNAYQGILRKYDGYLNELENKHRSGLATVTASEIFEDMNKLYRLENFGQKIREFSEAQLELQKEDILYDVKITPRSNTFSNFLASIK